MDHTLLQSTLRQWQAMARSWRLWGTFVAIVCVFIVTGPYDTGDKLFVWQRALYWTFVQGAGWIVTTCLSAFANAALARAVSSALVRMMVGAITAAAPIGVVVSLANDLFFAKPLGFAVIGENSLTALPLCILFCFLSYLTGSRPATGTAIAKRADDVTMSTVPYERPPLLDRMEPEKRGTLMRLCVRDHYTEVVTSRGSQLVLLRFSDALKEVGTIKGMQVHRSHWIADHAVSRLKRTEGRLFIVTSEGLDIPVSRPHLGAVRARFG